MWLLPTGSSGRWDRDAQCTYRTWEIAPRRVPVGKSADDRPGSAFVHGTRSYRPGLVRAAKRCLASKGAGSWP